jgi:hypothetical protein
VPERGMPVTTIGGPGAGVNRSDRARVGAWASSADPEERTRAGEPLRVKGI